MDNLNEKDKKKKKKKNKEKEGENKDEMQMSIAELRESYELNFQETECMKNFQNF